MEFQGVGFEGGVGIDCVGLEVLGYRGLSYSSLFVWGFYKTLEASVQDFGVRALGPTVKF